MYLGDFTTANTVYVYFNTFDSNDPSASVTLTGLATSDIFIYKNGSTTERSSTAGITLLDTDGIDFDAKTGIHGFSIDLSNNTDSGFFAAGGEYTVVVASVTVDAATVNFVAAQFSIERTGGALALLKGTNSLSDIESKIDTLQTNVGTAGAGLTNIGTIATVTNLTNLPTIPANWITAAGIDTGAIDADALAADAGTEIGTAVWATAARTLTAATNITSTGGTTVPQTGDSFARLGAPAGASVSADIAAIEAQTDDIGAAGAGLTAVPWNPSWDAEVQSEVADALVAFWTTPGTLVDLIWDEAIAGHAGAGSTGEALAGATAPTAAAVADAVWDEALAGHLSAGSTGEALNAAGAAGDPWTTTLPGAYTGSQAGKMLSDIITDTAVIGAAGAGLTAVPWNAAWDAEVQSEVADALAVYDPPTKAELDSGLAALNDLDAAGVATAVWNAATATYGAAGSYGLLVETNLDAPVSTVDTVVDSIKVDTAAILIDTADMQPKLGTPAVSISADIAAIEAQTDDIGAAGAGLTAIPWNAAWDAEVQSEVTDALNAYDPPTKAELDSAVAPLATAANLATVAGYLDTEIAAILEDTGTSLPASIASLDSLIDAIKLVTDALPNSGALTDLATAAALATVDGNVDAILVDTDTTIPGLIAALNDIAASDILTTALVESYSADGAAPTLSQAIFLIQQFLYERATVGTTVTVNKLDGATPAATLTLDNGTSPTSITRAT